MKNTQFHQTLFYKTEKGIHEKIIEFFSHGIRASERCVFLTTQSDAPQLLEHLKSNHDSSQVIKLFSYFNLPDPVSSPELFEEKMSRIREIVLNPSFEGRIAFNVLGDMSRFSQKIISEITEIENFLDTLASKKIKLFCTFKTGKENDSFAKMMKMAMSTHDHAIFENDDGSYSQLVLK